MYQSMGSIVPKGNRSFHIADRSVRISIDRSGRDRALPIERTIPGRSKDCPCFCLFCILIRIDRWIDRSIYRSIGPHVVTKIQANIIRKTETKLSQTETKLLEIKQKKFVKISLNCEEHSKQIHYIGILQVALL